MKVFTKKINSNVSIILILMLMLTQSASFAVEIELDTFKYVPVVIDLCTFNTWREGVNDLSFVTLGSEELSTILVKVRDHETKEVLFKDLVEPSTNEDSWVYDYALDDFNMKNNTIYSYKASVELNEIGVNELDISFYAQMNDNSYSKCIISGGIDDIDYGQALRQEVIVYYVNPAEEGTEDIDILKEFDINAQMKVFPELFESIIIREKYDISLGDWYSEIEIVLADSDKNSPISYLFTVPQVCKVTDISYTNALVGIPKDNNYVTEVFFSFLSYAFDAIVGKPISAVQLVLPLISNEAGESSLEMALDQTNLGCASPYVTFSNSIYSTEYPNKYGVSDNVSIILKCNEKYGKIIKELYKEDAMTLYMNVNGRESIIGNMSIKDIVKETKSNVIDTGEEEFEQGYLYYTGLENTSIDDERALKFFEEAMTKGSQKGKFFYGRLLYLGYGIEKDSEEGLRLMSEVVKDIMEDGDLGDSVIQEMIAKFYILSSDEDTDIKVAFEWAEKSAQQGDPLGIQDLGLCYASGSGIEQDINEAERLFEKASDMGLIWATTSLGKTYYYKKEYDDAYILLRKGADADDIGSMLTLALMYKDGFGVEQDYLKSYELLVKIASTKGNNTVVGGAQNQLGIYFEYGYGVDIDLDEAFKYYSKSAECDYYIGKFNLGRVYEHGIGVDSDFEKAVEWYQNSADQGFDKAIKALERLGF